MILGIGIGIIALLLFWAYLEECFIGVAVFFAIVSGVVSCNRSEWNQNMERERDKAAYELQIREQTPVMISQADGCKVYTFKAGGRWQYFTRCGTTTTTEASYVESCGKNCNKTVVNTITTSNTKGK